MKDLEILKRLLQEVEEDQIEDQDQEEETPKPGSFEEDPMSFILKKYSSLNEIMTELMTKDFKEFVDGIFIMAPKPTTFKVQLHNGQNFFLTFMKDDIYEATIQGKRYYLAGIGEKERCMMAIARLLRFGTPLKTKGPEGAEESTRDNTGMEGDWAEKTGNVAAGGEEEAGIEPAGEGGEEELAENRRILEALLKKEAKEPSADLFKALATSLGGKPESKKGKHIRTTIGGESEAIEAITKALDSIKIGKKDYEINVIPPNEFSKGSRSGTFNTYKVTLLKDLGANKKGSEIFIVSTVKEGKSTIRGKSLTPGAFGLEGKLFKNSDAIVKSVDSTLSSMPNKELAKALSLLVRDVNGVKSQKADNISEVKNYSKSIPLSKDTQKALSVILPGDIDKIGVDFGEILGAILMGKEVKLEKGIFFPQESNAALTDFFIDGYGISSKYKKGASATLTKIISDVDPENLTTKEEKSFYKNFSSAFQSGVAESYLKLAKKYNPEEMGRLAYIMGVNEKDITIQSINDYIIQLLNGKIPNDKNPKADKKIEQDLAQFFAVTKSKPAFPINWGNFKKGKYYGLIISPLAAAVAKKLNSDTKYTEALKGIVGKVEVKQLYLDFNLKSNSMSFKLKSFADPSSTFTFTPTNMSAYNPDNGKMGFTLK
jgi:hypothetical protein